MSANQLPKSAVSAAISHAGVTTHGGALPYEILHNLRYQHGWTELQLHEITSPRMVTLDPRKETGPLGGPSEVNPAMIISGIPPRHSYIHPDFLNHLIKHNMKEADIPVQREWVLPLSIGEKWSLRRFCAVFDCLPDRSPRSGALGYTHQDNKRVLAGMLAHNGVGGDGTIVYYIMQEGDVKPRQN